ncbi:MAG: hypothetical protein R3244_13920, partial [Thermoanaerobaculia bacterium]|nr:hypothetical protein [Thermoanaerobaculia bacterium]
MSPRTSTGSTDERELEEPARKQDADSFGAQAVAVLATLVALTLGNLFLRSESGLERLVDQSSRQQLTAELRGGVRPPAAGGVVVRSTQEGKRAAFVRQIELQRLDHYVVSVRAGAGAAFVVVLVDRDSRETIRFRVPARREAARYSKLVQIEGTSSGSYRLVVVPGREGRFVIEDLWIARVSGVRLAAPRVLSLLALGLIGLFVWRHRDRLRRSLIAPRRVDDRVLAGALFVLCFVLFRYAPVQQMMDARRMTAVSYSLLHEGSLSLPDGIVSSAPYQYIERDGRLYHYAYTVIAILSTPFVWLFEQLGISPMRGGRFDLAVELGMLRWIAAFLGAVLCAVLYRIARLWLDVLPAVGLTLAFALGTQIFSTVSRPFWSHAWAVAWIAIGVYLLLAPRRRGSPGWRIVALVALLLAALCRPVAGLSLLGGIALLWVDRGRKKRSWVPVVLALGAALALSAAISTLEIDARVFPERYRRYAWVLVSSPPSLTEFGSNALGSLISPARGLLLYVPLFGWIAWSILSGWRRLAARDVARVSVGVIRAPWWIRVLTRTWAGGQADGPRR